MKIYLGSAIYRQIHAGTHTSLVLLEKLCAQRGIEFEEWLVVGDALVDRARNIAASTFLRSDSDVLLTIDSDISFRPEDAIRICEEAMDKGIVGGLYMTRAMQSQPAMMLPPERRVNFAPNGELTKVPFLSTGFLAVHKRVFKGIINFFDMPLCHVGWENKGTETSFYPFFLPMVMPWEGEGNIYLSEDWAFCERAKEAGYDCWLDPSFRLIHYGEVGLTLEDLIRPARSEPVPMQLLRHKNGRLETMTPDKVAILVR